MFVTLACAAPVTWSVVSPGMNVAHLPWNEQMGHGARYESSFSISRISAMGDGIPEYETWNNIHPRFTKETP